MSDIFLIRHGRTPMNAAGLLRGRLNPELDLIGQAEARELAEQLGSLDLVRLISSPALRAVQTAEPLAAALGLKTETDPRLLDRDYADFNGASVDEVRERYGSLDAAPGVEPAEAVVARARAVLDELVAAEPSGPVAVVSHDAVIRLLLDALTPRPQHTQHVQPRTGSWSLIHNDGDVWTLLMADSKDDPVETVLAGLGEPKPATN